jgi:dephospho-CoA kinase
MTKTISIKELNIDSIRPNMESLKSNLGGSKITIIGKPGSGKSILIKHLLYAKKHVIPTGIVISGSEDSNKFYSTLFPDLFIYDKFKKEIVENFVKRQKLAKDLLPNAWACLVMKTLTVTTVRDLIAAKTTMVRPTVRLTIDLNLLIDGSNPSPSGVMDDEEK